MPDIDLKKLKQVLQDQFDEAVKRHPSYEDSNYSNSSTPFNPRIESRIAIAELANALINAQREERAQRRDQQELEERKNGIKLPGK